MRRKAKAKKKATCMRLENADLGKTRRRLLAPRHGIRKPASERISKSGNLSTRRSHPVLHLHVVVDSYTMPLDPTSEFWSLGPRQIVGCETSEDGGLVWKVDVRKRETRTLTTHAPRLEGLLFFLFFFF